MLQMSDIDVGGARIRRTFKMGDRQMKFGDPDLTAEQVLSISPANRRALIDAQYIEPYPRPPVSAAVEGERFMVQVSKTEFNVYKGVKLNTAPLTRAQAEAMVDGN